MHYILIGILFLQIACSSSAQQITTDVQQVKAVRKPFQKSSVVIKSPTSYVKRESQKGEYDPNPRVVLIDEKAGKYELRWIGYDGKEKIIKYQRADSLDALVEARVEKSEAGRFLYRYLIKNLPESPAYLSGFTIQTFAKDIRDEPFPIVNNIFTGHMGNYIPEFSDGVWRRFAVLEDASTRIGAGKNIEFSLVSSALPGIVGCRATGGDLILKGVGEHKPYELEMATPGYEGWARGYTIGPIDKLAEMTRPERSQYLIDSLPKFVEAGWMAGDTPKIYETILKRDDLSGALEQARKDLEKEFITSEVFHIIEGLNR